jgi:hypothetical protein
MFLAWWVLITLLFLFVLGMSPDIFRRISGLRPVAYRLSEYALWLTNDVFHMQVYFFEAGVFL